MTEVSTRQAAAIINTSYMTIHRRANDGKLNVRREGLHRDLRIELDDLREFAKAYGYKFNEDLARQYTTQDIAG